MVERVGTPDEVVVVKIHVAKGQKVADVHRKKIGPGRPGKGQANCSGGRARRWHEA